MKAPMFLTLNPAPGIPFILPLPPSRSPWPSPKHTPHSLRPISQTSSHGPQPPGFLLLAPETRGPYIPPKFPLPRPYKRRSSSSIGDKPKCTSLRAKYIHARATLDYVKIRLEDMKRRLEEIGEKERRRLGYLGYDGTSVDDNN